MEGGKQLGQRGTEREGGARKDSVIFCTDLGWLIADYKLNIASFPQRR